MKDYKRDTLLSAQEVADQMQNAGRGTRLARWDFSTQTKLIDLRMPIFYDVNNILILYEHHVSGDRARAKTVHNAAIEKSIEKLYKDEVVFKLDRSYNVEKLEQFLAHVRNGTPDQLKVTSMTIEGDPIFTYAIWDGKKLTYGYDNSEDAYGGTGKGLRKSECTSVEKKIEKTDGGSYARYIASGCLKQNPTLHIASIPLVP